MDDLYVEDRLREAVFDSVEEYLKFHLGLGGSGNVQFFDVRTFKSLYEAGLIAPRMSIRTSDGGMVNRHYWVTDDGKLEGVTEEPYQGEEGIFEPEHILSGDRVSSGWTIESISGFSVMCRQAGMDV